MALRLEEYDWVETFIEENKQLLKPEEQENAYTYNKALLHFHKHNYDRTLELLRNVEFTDVFYNLDCKALLMKTFYDKNELDPLFSLMDAFYVYLRRNKLISASNRDSYSNFLRFVKKLIKYKNSSREKIEQLEHELYNTASVANLTWLRGKIEEMKK